MIPVAEEQYCQSGLCEAGDTSNIRVKFSDALVVRS
jgi:hypothetical protein